jgi:hypothetical protein
MKAYFDTPGEFNLHSLSTYNGNPWITFSANSSSLIEIGKVFDLSFDRKYNEVGVYFINVRGLANDWLENNLRHPITNILDHIPSHILEQVIDKKIIIAIDSAAEGFPLNINGTTGYKLLHNFMGKFLIPDYYLMFIDSNKHFVNNYESWCFQNNVKTKISHAYALTGFFYFDNRVPNYPLIIDAINNQNSSDFNSLNRTARLHRIDHILYLLKHNLIDGKNLISAGLNKSYINHQRSTILTGYNERYREELFKKLPITIDGDWTIDTPEITDKTTFNHDIYKNSLLSFVTETIFSYYGLFITEKIFKPIVAGHPFIVLGQPGILSFLQELGYKTNFYGIDSSYDLIKNPRERFYAAHQSLQKWISLPRDEKINCIMKSMEIFEHNIEHFKKQDYINWSYNNIKNTAEQVFSNQYRRFNI